MFKVVARFGEGLYSIGSFLMKAPTESWIVKYLPGQWVSAAIGGLFVFSQLEDAQSFILRMGFSEEINTARYKGVEIWECEIQNAREDISFVLLFPDEGLKEFWLDPANRSHILSIVAGLQPKPVGTVICESVKLIRKIE
jgi:hypothetical protein